MTALYHWLTTPGWGQVVAIVGIYCGGMVPFGVWSQRVMDREEGQ